MRVTGCLEIMKGFRCGLGRGLAQFFWTFLVLLHVSALSSDRLPSLATGTTGLLVPTWQGRCLPPPAVGQKSFFISRMGSCAQLTVNTHILMG